MNILYISSEYPPETGNGGIATYTKYIAEAMVLLGHNVSVITQSIDQKYHHQSNNGIMVYRIPPTLFPLPAMRFAYPFRRLISIFFYHTLVRLSWIFAVHHKISSMLKRCNRFDIIESPECGAEGLCIPRNASRCRIVRLHTPWELIRKYDRLKERAGDRFLLPLLEKISVYQSDAVSTPSHAMQTYAETNWHLKHITVIPNPLPVDKYMNSNGSGWIYTGRIERRKGVHHLVAAFKRLCMTCPSPPQLTLIGAAYGIDESGTSFGSHIRQTISTIPHGNIRWIDHIPHETVAGYLQQSSVAFFPSLWENYPYSCLEAMASSCAVIAADCGGFSEIIINNIHGLLIPANSTDVLYNAMLFVYNHPESVVNWQQAARKRVIDIASTSMVGKKTEHFYRQLLERKRETVFG